MSKTEIISFLEEMKEESGISKLFKEKADSVIGLLQSNQSLCIEKAVAVLEDVESLEISSYHRTQVWEVVSMLESMENLN